MWVFFSDAMLSVVAYRGRDTLMVRARLEGDIERVFPRAKVTELPTGEADYRFRAEVSREWVAQALAARVRSIDYDDFKSSVRDYARHNAYFGVWSTMQRAQWQQAGEGEPGDWFGSPTEWALGEDICPECDEDRAFCDCPERVRP